MATGTVKWFDDSKGFGFIKPFIESTNMRFPVIGPFTNRVCMM